VHDTPQTPPELFHLTNDPTENDNLRSQQPQQFEKLRRALQRHIQQGGQVPWQ
jgi:hypothetical protein